MATHVSRRQLFGQVAGVAAGMIASAALLDSLGCASAPTPTPVPPKPAAEPTKPAAAPAASAPTTAPAAPAPTAAPAAPAATMAPAAPTAAPPAAAATQVPAGGAPKAGGTLTLGQTVDINGLDPHIANLNVMKVIKENIWDQLTFQDPTDFEIKGKLAKSWEWTDNNTSLVFTLQSGVTFHNGDKLTAADVKFSLDRILDPKTAAFPRSMIAVVKEIQVVDDLHVRLKTDQVQNQIIPGLTYCDILPKSITDDAAIKKTPVGSGPFKFVEWIPNDHITLIKNPSYWMPGKPLLDKIIFKPITEEESRMSQLMAGQIDLIYDVALKNLARLQSTAGITTSVLKPVDQMFVAYMNIRKPPFNNLKARQAMSYAFDRASFVKNFLGGFGRPSWSPFTPDVWAYNPKMENYYPFDLDKAAAALAEAGFPKGAGLNFSFLVPTGYPEFKQIAEQWQGAIAKLGYQPAIQEVEIAQWSTAGLNQTREFEIAPDYPPRGSTDPALTFSAGLQFPVSAANIIGLQPDTMPGYADLIVQGATSLDRNKRKDIYGQIQELWAQYCPSVILAHRSTGHGLKPYVKGFLPHPAFQQDFSGVWLDK